MAKKVAKKKVAKKKTTKAKGTKQKTAKAKPATTKETKTEAVSAAWMKRLKAQKKKWRENRQDASKPAFEDVPPGKYIVRLIEAALKETRKGALSLVTKFVVLRGDQRGSIIQRWDGLENERSMEFLPKYLYQLGVPNVEHLDIDELPDVCAHLMEEQQTFRITVVQDGDFARKTIDSQVDYDEDEDEDSDESEELENDEDEDEDDESEDEDDESEDEDEDSDESEDEDEDDDEDEDEDASDESEDEDDKSEDEDEDEEIQPAPGDIVEFELKGKAVQGSVVKVLRNKQQCVVKIPKSKKRHTVDWDDLAILMDEE